MATESVSNLSDLLKEVWTQNRLEKQFYGETRFLDRVQRTNKYTIGREALVPLEARLPGGDSSVPASGSSSLNAADDLAVDRADYDITHHWRQIAIETAALNQADSVGLRSTVDSLDQTVESNLLGMRKNLNRQVVSNGDALIAQCTAGAANTTVLLDPAGYGYDAIVRGWIRPGLTVDIGTTANEVAVADAVTISSVDESSSAPSFVASASVTETANDYVSIANARAGTTSYEANGLRTIAGSTTTAIGGLDPQNAGEEFWSPAKVDTTTTVPSLDLLLDLQRAVYQKVGKWPSYVTTSPKVAADLYALFQSQVRFTSDDTKAGNAHGFVWNGIEISVDPDIPDRELYMLTLEDFLVVLGGRISKPTWVSDIEGSGGQLRWSQGSTKFVDALTYAMNVAIKRRNSHAAALGLTG
jgi:hypothetical protein